MRRRHSSAVLASFLFLCAPYFAITTPVEDGEPADVARIQDAINLSEDGEIAGVQPGVSLVYYVDADANGNNDGSSWTDAFVYLQDALAAAEERTNIRVAQGTYRPDLGIGITTGDREATFHLESGVIIKGGCAGFGETDPNDRDVAAYETILSGDLNGDDESGGDKSENSHHVLALEDL